MKYFLTLVGMCFMLQQYAQFTDNFDDGDFTLAPVWIGDDSVFTVVNSSGNNLLRSNKCIPSSSYYLATASAVSMDCQWELYTNLQFNTSGANFVDVFLCSDVSDLSNPAINGYFVRIGGSTDEISLFKKTGGVTTKIIDGMDGVTNTSNNKLKIRVRRSSSNNWTLERDITGIGNSYMIEGEVTDATISGSNFFGLAITQSTSSFCFKHFFDQIYVGPIIYDVSPPILNSASASSSVQVDIQFNEPLDPISAINPTNFTLNYGANVVSAALDGADFSIVHLSLQSAMVNGTTYTLTTNSVSDEALNISGVQTTQFTYLTQETPEKGDVIINEFICDQSPSFGLPEVEYVEIYNRSSKYFNLSNWKLGDASSDGTLQNGWLFPGEYKILCASSHIDTFSVQGLGVINFPSFNNSGDDIFLKDENGIVLDKISYTDQWYRDANKAEGGHSLELINPNDPCSGMDNWIASNHQLGGTPGLVNSVFDSTPDTQVPSIVSIFPQILNTLELEFSEGMDSTLLKNALIITDPPLTLINHYVPFQGALTSTVQFAESIIPSKEYKIQLLNAGDCWYNMKNFTETFALPESPEMGDLVINEILFDPLTGGSDWVEIYNASHKLIDLKDCFLANYDNDTIANQKKVIDHFYLKPDCYAVLGKDSAFVKQHYTSVPGTFVFCEIPSYTSDSSTVYLIFNDHMLDQVSYKSDWHFKLLESQDGVSLERIATFASSNTSSNWHSAAESIGFATPGSKNSQYRPSISIGDFSFTSETMSPDNDGFEDILQINYQLSLPGMLGSLTIYDERGHRIKSVINNELLSPNGTIVWDGVTDKNTKASIGIYVAVFEAFDLSGGTVFTKTKAFVVAGKL